MRAELDLVVLDTFTYHSPHWLLSTLDVVDRALHFLLDRFMKVQLIERVEGHNRVQQMSRIKASSTYLLLILQTEENKLIAVGHTLIALADARLVHKVVQVLALILFVLLQLRGAVGQTDTPRQALSDVPVLALVYKRLGFWLCIALPDIDIFLISFFVKEWLALGRGQRLILNGCCGSYG